MIRRSAVRFLLALAFVLAPVAMLAAPAQASDNPLVREVIEALNRRDSVRGSEHHKSYKILFDAYLKLTKPPFEIGPHFNLNTIHPKMSSWSAVSAWAESNHAMAEAILACKDKNIFGLPYGREKLEQPYISANLVADIGVDGRLRNLQFSYLNAIETIAAFATAEVYRLMEAGQPQRALDLATAHAFVLRQCCDREFLEEKLRSIELLSSALSNLRDVFHLYLDRIPAEQFTRLAQKEIPYLRPDRGRLFMPEADRVLAEALIKDVFDDRTGMPDPDKFTEAYAEIQAKEAPLTRFGASKRWAMIAAIHGSKDASLDRLKLVYDDWWRRWRIDAYDDILSIKPQFDRINPIRYAAVIHSVENVSTLFVIRNRLIAEVNGTVMAAGLCAHRRTFNAFPEQLRQTYGSVAPKRSDSDPYDKQLGPFRYRVLTQAHTIDTDTGHRIRLEAGTPLMWSRGQDHEDQQATRHSDDGATGDIVLWPPIKSVLREQGMIE